VSSPPGASSRDGTSASLLVRFLFVSTVLLSIVSWYTTYQGMALYLSPWFALLASFGIQSALVLVAWLTGTTSERKPLLIGAYIITAVVSVAFSYVSLYTWFSAKERPAIVQRQLYDTLMTSSGKTSEMLTAAITAAERHTLALNEITQAERSQGFAARTEDSDPYLTRIREAVAKEAQAGYREGAGQGVRFAAFERYTKLSKQSLDQLQQSRRALEDFRALLKPHDPSEQQIRQYRAVYDAIPWSEIESHLNKTSLAKPPVPSLSENLDRVSTGQEELLLAFTELIEAPTGRHIFSFLLAAFIDVIVFLLAFSAGPHFAGSPEQRWREAAAALDGAPHTQVFARDLLRKFEPDAEGKPRVSAWNLTPGEQQFLLTLAGKRRACLHQGFYLLDEQTHEQLMETVGTRKQLSLRVPPPAAPATAANAPSAPGMS
jgi:hypothetical protein